MAESLKPQQHQQQEPEQQTATFMNTKPQQKRLCDYCNDTTALLYCRADSARLCLSCDHEVHSTNQLFSKHTRSLLCDDCHASPVSIFCETEHSALCQNCDYERHRLSSFPSTHNRRPIEGFTGCPSVNELMAILGFEDPGHKQSVFFSEEADGFMGSGLDDEYSDLLVWDSPAVSIDDLIMSSDPGPDFKASGVPLLPKASIHFCFLIMTVKLKLVRAENGEAANQVFLPSTLPGSNFEESCSVPDKEINISDSASHINDGHEAEPQPLTIGTLPHSSVKKTSGTINVSGTNLARFGQKAEQESRVVLLSWIIESGTQLLLLTISGKVLKMFVEVIFLELLQVSGEAQDMEFITSHNNYWIGWIAEL
ncbi:hypothetical protein SADUNF_Sadunf14G0100600 [Salix dunnii]|uniref:B box-type domain-containing protein n=1 Tax=Salix dunnii TaxID=1413687 RepID=A0A835JLP7_9ROSI|nr:hypothetical protein SADUNF_Sadunf14G0100600 [Salix dunnii]